MCDPILTEEDVPNATLDLNNLESYTLEKLKGWLRSRNKGVGGNKAELIRRYGMDELYMFSYLTFERPILARKWLRADCSLPAV